MNRELFRRVFVVVKVYSILIIFCLDFIMRDCKCAVGHTILLGDYSHGIF